MSITKEVPPFRTVTAQLIIVRPNKATRSHKRAVLKCQTTDTLEVIGEDGSVEVLGDESTGDAGAESGTSNGTGDDTQVTTDGNGECVSSGDDLILLTRKKSRNSDDLVVRATERVEKIDQRLEKIIARLESQGKTDRIESIVQRTEERKQKEQERLEKALSRAEEKDKRAIERALNKSKGRDK